MRGSTALTLSLMCFLAILLVAYAGPAYGIIIAIEAGCWAIADTIGNTIGSKK